MRFPRPSSSSPETTTPFSAALTAVPSGTEMSMPAIAAGVGLLAEIGDDPATNRPAEFLDAGAGRSVEITGRGGLLAVGFGLRVGWEPD